MFCCIGIKVKWLAKLILWLGSAASVIIGVIMLAAPTPAVLTAAQEGWLVIVLGVLGSLAVSLVTYAIGVAADGAGKR